jgi:hypothetical protein
MIKFAALQSAKGKGPKAPKYQSTYKDGALEE